MKALRELGISPWPWNTPSCTLSEGFVWGGDSYAVCHISGKPSDAFNAMHEIAKLEYPTLSYSPPCAWNDYANPEKAKANASLIAAVPEMAKVCYDLIMWDGCRDASICDIVAAAKAAYAKASGEETK